MTLTRTAAGLVAALLLTVPAAAQEAEQEVTTYFEDGTSVTVTVREQGEAVSFVIQQRFEAGPEVYDGERLEVTLQRSAMSVYELERLLYDPPRSPSQWLRQALGGEPPARSPFDQLRGLVDPDDLEEGLEDLTRGLRRGWRDLRRELPDLDDLGGLLPWGELRPEPPTPRAERSVEAGPRRPRRVDDRRAEVERPIIVLEEEVEVAGELERFPGEAESTGLVPVGTQVEVTLRDGTRISGRVVHSDARELRIDTGGGTTQVLTDRIQELRTR
jgi:hypothetical protein